MMSKEMNLESIKLSHDNWFAKIEYYLDGHLVPRQDIVVSHSECELGKRFYDEGKEIYGNIRAVKFLEIKHEKLHKIAQYIWDAYNNGDFELAKILYSDMLAVSKRIISIFNEAQEFINDKSEKSNVINF
ncbi:CZB domain-containing protein [Flavobacterium sp.]|uniref:CZB domain-containing protein n=1 Tax=Flavobacterium sp. TaxID=239 RepID=UPI00375037B7